MYTNKRFFKDKSIIALSIVSVMALSGLAANIMLSNNDNNDSGISQIAELDETSTKLQNAAANVMKETTTSSDNAAESTESSTEKPSGLTSSATKSNSTSATVPTTEQTTVAKEEDASVNAPASAFSFTANSVLVWPVETNDIIIDFSMDSTTYFATLDMYKTSDAVCIRSNIGSPVYAAADGIVTANSYNEETGRFISMDIGDNYELTYGQLKDIQVEEGSIVSVGDLIGYISEPTKYYSVEGANLYLKMTCNAEPADPLDYLNFDEN